MCIYMHTHIHTNKKSVGQVVLILSRVLEPLELHRFIYVKNTGQDLNAPEPWHRHCLLRGHQGEVCDVAWP